MPYSTQDAMAAYGYVFQIANAIPELKGLLDAASANMDSPDKLRATIESSPWWMQHADTVRNLAIQKAAEPGTYNQNLSNAMDSIKLKAQELGRTFTAQNLHDLAIRTLTENAGMDTKRLDELVTNSLHTLAGGPAGNRGGTAAYIQDHLRQMASDYGQPMSQGNLDNWTAQIQSGANTIDGFESGMRMYAKSAYPPLAAQIDAGKTVKDIADPYVQTMAQTLEVPTTSINWNSDPYVKKALTTRNTDGTPTIQPLWQFTQQVKQDPRYDKTVQARTDAYTTLAHVKNDWGF